MRPLIYIPGREDRSPAEHFAAVGLGEISAGLDVMRPTSGPVAMSGDPGLLFGWLSPTQNQFDYFPDKQTWIKSAANGDLNAGAYWVGIWNESPPTEEDLRRPDHRAGAQVVLGDDGSWSIPTLGQMDRIAKLQDDGRLVWCVDEQYNWLVTDLEKREATGTIPQDPEPDGTAKLKAEGIRTFLFDDTADWFFLSRVLQINYRITPELVSYLGLLSRDSVRGIVSGMMGLTLKG